MRCFGKQRIHLAPLLDFYGFTLLDESTAVLSHAVFDRWSALLAISEEHAFAAGMETFRLNIKGDTECALFIIAWWNSSVWVFDLGLCSMFIVCSPLQRLGLHLAAQTVPLHYLRIRTWFRAHMTRQCCSDKRK